MLHININYSQFSCNSVMGEIVMVKNMQNLFSGLEPLLRRVVSNNSSFSIINYTLTKFICNKRALNMIR